MRVEEAIRVNSALKSHLRSAENALEHLPLFVIGNFFTAWNTDSGQSARETLLGDEELFIVVSVVISALSAIRGQESRKV